MSKQPQTDAPESDETEPDGTKTDGLPHAVDGVDPARIEEAFTVFAERVRELESVAGELRAELRSLRAERAAPVTRFDQERWPVERSSEEAGANPSPDWVGSVPTPIAHGFGVPRLVLEGAFLLLVALFAGLADLPVVWIVLVMVAAWTLVVLSEWAAAAKRARWRLDEIAEPLESATEVTGPWDAPVVQATVIQEAADPESKTIVTKLPPAQPPAQPDAASEPVQEPDPVADPAADPAEEAAPPKRRRGLRRRKQPAEAGAPDPWEA